MGESAGTICPRKATPRRSMFTRALRVGVLLGATSAFGDILRWDDGTVIPGTSGITPGVGIDLSGWNTPGHVLDFASLSSVNMSLGNFSVFQHEFSKV